MLLLSGVNTVSDIVHVKRRACIQEHRHAGYTGIELSKMTASNENPGDTTLLLVRLLRLRNVVVIIIYSSYYLCVQNVL